MNTTVFTEMLSVIDDAIGLADSAVKSAEAAQSRAVGSPAAVTLVKVAADRCAAAAETLVKTGAFGNTSRKDLANSLEKASPAGLLELLEKLASRAVFPLDVDSFGSDGDLVDKSAANRTEVQSAESKTDLWGRCCAEVGLG